MRRITSIIFVLMLLLTLFMHGSDNGTVEGVFPEDMDFIGLAGLSREVQEKLSRLRPVSLGQASRISGVTPAAITTLMIHLKKIGVL